MNEDEFDALMKSRSFGTGDMVQWEAEQRANTGLVMTLGVALWGKTSEDTQRQLLASHPEVPLGFDLADFRKLLQLTAKLVLLLQRMRGGPPSIVPSPTVFIVSEGLNLWEARCEIVRRAIDYLERR